MRGAGSASSAGPSGPDGDARPAGHGGLYPEVGATTGEAPWSFGFGAGRFCGIPTRNAYSFMSWPKPVGIA